LNEKIRVRVAPSPTGFLHIGTARTTLVNYLYAKKYGGKLILRLEDTDVERSRPEFERDIIENLHWLGLDWDEGPDIGGDFGPYRQSERRHTYQPFAEQLIQSGHLYPCYCTPEELDAHRQASIAQGKNVIYSGRCRNLTRRERAQFENEGRKPSWRFRVPQTMIEFADLIQGSQKLDMSIVGDFILLDSEKRVLFLLSNVIDDYLMELSPVIRGQDHLSNTPRQILIYQALGVQPPQYGHLPLILNPDRTKMSKRQGGTTVREYKENGFLPEALINYFALLGWTPEDARDIYKLDELIQFFDLKLLGISPSAFDSRRLEWMNGKYIRMSNLDSLAHQLLPFLIKDGLIANPPTDREKDIVRQFTPLIKERLITLGQVSEKVRFFFGEPTISLQMFPDNMAVDQIKQYLSVAQAALSAVESFTAKDIETEFLNLITRLNTTKKNFLMTIRVAVTGSRVTPPLFESLEILGRDTIIKRIGVAIVTMEGKSNTRKSV